MLLSHIYTVREIQLNRCWYAATLISTELHVLNRNGKLLYSGSILYGTNDTLRYRIHDAAQYSDTLK